MDLWYNNQKGIRARCGQAMLEYLLAFVALFVAVFALYALVRAAWRYADRTEALVSSDCP